MASKGTKGSGPGLKQWAHALRDEELAAKLSDERKRLDEMVKSEYERESQLTSVKIMEQSARVDALVNEKILRSVEEANT